MLKLTPRYSCVASYSAMNTHEEDEEIKAFSCRVENVKTITDILNCLCIDVNKAQPCDVEATPDSKYCLHCLLIHRISFIT